MSENVNSIPALQSYNDIMNANAQMMTEIYGDPKLTAAEKLRNFSIGVRNQIMLSRDLASRRAELMRCGLKAADDLKAVVHCLGLTTREYLAIVEDPLQPGQFTVLNKAEINLSVPEVRWGLTLNADSFTPQAAARVEALNEKGRHNAAACLAESRKVGQPVESGERIPRQIGMIAYVDSPEALQRFHSVIHEWRENVQDFGHRNVVFRLCDDSPEPFSSKIRSLLEQQP